MKHIYRRFILSAVLVFPVVISAGAQELAGDNASSLQNDSLVQVAFRKVSQNNLCQYRVLCRKELPRIFRFGRIHDSL